MNFKANHAERSGGAILVEDVSSTDDFTVIYNILCFVQYEIERSGTRELPANQWVCTRFVTIGRDLLCKSETNLLLEYFKWLGVFSSL